MFFLYNERIQEFTMTAYELVRNILEEMEFNSINERILYIDNKNGNSYIFKLSDFIEECPTDYEVDRIVIEKKSSYDNRTEIIMVGNKIINCIRSIGSLGSIYFNYMKDIKIVSIEEGVVIDNTSNYEITAAMQEKQQYRLKDYPESETYKDWENRMLEKAINNT